MTEKDFSEEQVVHVQRIKRCKDYYEVLQVSKDASESDLKKNYRKLALQLHPDKNKAPGASEAFKAVGNAFAVLSDKEKRRQYDLYGSEDTNGGAPSTGPARRHTYYDGGDGYYYDYSRGFEGNVSAEELFNMFFGGGFPTGNVYVRRPRQRHSRQNANQEESPAHSILLQAMPLLILIGVSLFSQFMVSDPPFSLQRTSKYMHERTTMRLQVPYYVKDSFIKDYQGSIRRVEQEVEEDYMTLLRQNCFRERNYKESMLWRARSFRDHEMEEQAKNIRTPSCAKLQKYAEQIHSY